MAYGYGDLFLCNEVGSLLTLKNGLQRPTLAKALEKVTSKDPRMRDLSPGAFQK